MTRHAVKKSILGLAVCGLIGFSAPGVSRADGGAAAPATPTAPAPGGGLSQMVQPAEPAVVQDNVVVDEHTARIIHGALKYLASKQLPNGSWTDGNPGHTTAITGYVVMAFLANGNTPNEGEFGKSVARAAAYLMECVGPDGYMHPIGADSAQGMYGHGIGTIALAEIYGQTRDPKIRAKLVSAVNLIIKCQNAQGGWRYRPRVADADISVTVLQCVALRAAKNDGLDIPQESVDHAISFIKACRDPRTGGFCYQNRGGGANFARTAAGIYSLQVCGLYDDPDVKDGARYIEKNPIQMNGFFGYGQFYAAPAEYMIGGDSWKNWYETISKFLLSKVKEEGDTAYWTPMAGDPGIDYATAVYTTILSMPYHYLPLYQR